MFFNQGINSYLFKKILTDKCNLYNFFQRVDIDACGDETATMLQQHQHQQQQQQHNHHQMPMCLPQCQPFNQQQMCPPQSCSPFQADLSMYQSEFPMCTSVVTSCPTADLTNAAVNAAACQPDMSALQPDMMQCVPKYTTCAPADSPPPMPPSHLPPEHCYMPCPVPVPYPCPVIPRIIHSKRRFSGRRWIVL